MAFFSCSGRGLFEEVELPRPIRDRNVIVETAWVRPLPAVLDEYHRCRVHDGLGQCQPSRVLKALTTKASSSQGSA